MTPRLRSLHWLSAVLISSLWFSVNLTAHGVEYESTVVAGKRVVVCRVDVAQEQLELFLNDDSGQPLKSFENLDRWLGTRGQKLVFAMNAGMYHRDFAPVGLHVADGRQIAPLNTAAGEGNFFLKPNGVFVLSRQGAAVRETSEMLSFSDPIRLATQSGPLLVRNGKIHPAFPPGSQNRLLRNGVGVPAPGKVIFAIADDPVNFHEFATFFRDTLHCSDALFLDGTVSSLHAPELGRSDKRIDLGPMIGIVGAR
jgi:uncharacterized protein YigE (DUF2233 family)